MKALSAAGGLAFFDVQVDVGGMDEAELPLGLLPVKLAVTLHRRPAVWARVDDGDPIEDPSVADGVGLENLDREPLIGVSSAHL